MKKTFYTLALGAIFLSFLGVFLMPEDASSATRRSSRSSRYSSSLNRKIRALDEDPVKHMPVPILLGVAPGQLSDTWGEARSQGRSHEGTDIFAPRGAFVVSPTEAVVTSKEINSSRNSLGGTYVWTANPGGERFYYAHLDSIADNIEVGTVLKKGDLIGYVGNTGNASGGATHLHFGIYDSGPTNPYPRLTEQFTDKERIDELKEILDDADNADTLALSLVSQYKSFFVGAEVRGVDLPVAFADALKNSSLAPVNTVNNGPAYSAASIGTRNLTVGMSGSDVTKLQSILIAQNKGPAAAALAAAGGTGYFGAITQAALAEYQASAGISPASGYFGPLTKNSLQTAGLL